MEASQSGLAVLSVLLLLLSCPAEACRRKPRDPPVDRSPPTVTSCPSSRVYNADAQTKSAIVTWDAATAYDSSGASVEREDGNPNSGNRFHVSGSPYWIHYSATDGKNTNQDLCKFSITIKVITCGSLPSVSHGHRSCSHVNIFGSICTATCGEGYSITSGSKQRTCLEKGVWSNSEPQCTAISCPPLEGTVCTNGYFYNSICTHSCGLQGYSIAPGQTPLRVCRSNRQWTGESPTCIDTEKPTLSCPETIVASAGPSGPYAEVNWMNPITVTDNSKVMIEAVQTVGLSPGSVFAQGLHIVTYEATDKAGNTATCTFSVFVQVVVCPSFTLQPGQTIMCTSNFNLGSNCSFACAIGYVLEGASSSECIQESMGPVGNWTAEQPTCEAITCPHIPSPANGNFIGDVPCPNLYGSLCIVQCDEGYRTSGSGIRRCLALPQSMEGFWDGYETVCEEQTCPRAYVSRHSYITNDDECPPTSEVPAEVTCLFACNQGHILTGASEVMCQLDGIWDLPTPYCEAVRCDSSELPAPENGVKNACPNDEEIFGTTCTLVCNHGFMPVQPTYFTCIDDGEGNGQWDGNALVCEAVKCDPLDLPTSPGYMPITCNMDGTDVDQLQAYTTVCTSYCDLGYTSSGTGSRTCLLSGQWDGTPLVCFDTTAPTLTCPFDTTVFAEQGTDYGVFDYEQLSVEAEDASGDVTATLISINGKPVQEPQSSIFSEGTYRLVYSATDAANNSATCSFVLDIVVTKCPPLYGPRNSQTTLLSGVGDCESTTVYGSMCAVLCDEGYTLTTSGMSAVMVCSKQDASLSFGYWEGPEIDCIANECTIPPLDNGYISGCVGEEVEYQTSCSFVCNPGYHSNQIASRRTCLADGNWTEEEYVCEVVMCPGYLTLERGSVSPVECSTELQLPYNTRCTFNCAGGYSLSGAYSTTCSGVGVWSDSRTPTCTDYEPPVFNTSCPVYVDKIAPPGMRQAFVTFAKPLATDNSNEVHVQRQDLTIGPASSFAEGTTRLTYIAEDANLNRRRCDVYVTVEVLRCPPQQAPASGSLANCSANIYGATCSFSCNMGYELMGSDDRSCDLVDNFDDRVEWTGETATCLPITCPALSDQPLPAIRSGCFNYPPATERLGTTCQWYCPYGFQGVGSPRSRCLASSSWDVVNFTCEERSCPPLQATVGMVISPPDCLSSPAFNDNCFFQCTQSGYRVDPPSYNFIRCLGNGDWSYDSTNFSCVDYVSPHFTTCPLDFTVYSIEGAPEATVTWEVVAADNSPDVPTVQCEPQRPALLTVGIHAVRCTASDATGNEETCSFDVRVKVRTCRQLNPPFFGNFVNECLNEESSTCHVTCQSGYTLYGAETAKCSLNASTGAVAWVRNGSYPICKIAACTSVPSSAIPANGGVYPAFCRGTVQPVYGTLCQFYCANGFALTGPDEHREINCLPDGSWDVDPQQLTITCQDNMAPTLRVCPGSLTGSMSGTSLGVELSFDVPVATDNSQEVSVVKTPEDIDSPYNFTHDTTVSYIFSDAAGNQVECTFLVAIHDNLSPVVDFCPEDQNIITNLINTVVTWEEPVFRELTGDDLAITCSHESGVELRWGTTFVQCTATNLDNGKTSICQFTVMIEPTGCPDLRPPRNGATACDDWSYGYFCSLLCNINYETMNLQPLYVCGSNGEWSPPYRRARCGTRRMPLDMEIETQLQYFTGDCTSPATQDEIRNKFIQSLSGSAYSDICTEAAAECRADNVVVTCGAMTSRRDARDVDWDVDSDGSARTDGSAGGNVTEEEALTMHAQKWLADMQARGILPVDRRPKHRQPSHRRPTPPSHPDGSDLPDRRRRAAQTHELTISFKMLYPLPQDPDMNEDDFIDEQYLAYDNLYIMADEIYAMAWSGELQPDVAGLEMALQDVYYEEPLAACDFGYFSSYKLTCVGCAVGTYFNNDTETCEECPIGQYQDEDNKFVCKTCPQGTSTVETGSDNSTQCLEICPSGQFSSTGLWPCFKCSKGTYQSEERSTDCDPCMVGQSTAFIGSTHPEDCLAVCLRGSFSATGVQPCTPCPLHSYQSEEGQSSCMPCLARKITLRTGSVSSDHCELQLFCSDNTCLNGGTCMEQMESYRCDCPEGLTGNNCQVNVDDCVPGSCMNDGVCVDGLNFFTCICSAGFEGEDCSIDVDYCADTPCMNAGTCHDQTSGFTCSCDAGFTGSTCATDIDECQSLPCQNDGSCLNLDGDYRCECQAGFTGDRCETNVDECRSIPCQRNGTCIDGRAEYRCICPVGYVGHSCEVDVDLCEVDPCRNGATCQDLDDRYQCACPRGFAGLHCELELDPCDFAPCQNAGVCRRDRSKDSGYECLCVEGFDGVDCDIDVVECASDPCSNDGTCVDGINSYGCICVEGFEGPQCEQRTDLCDPNPCHYDAVCQHEGGDYFCSCPVGLSGWDCEIVVNVCYEGITCLNNGSCAAPSSDETCVCLEGFVGEHCETDVDDCTGKPCGSHAICIDATAGFTCQCLSGYSGDFCDVDINECASNPCTNGASCVDRVDGYKCLCPAGFSGIQCEVDIDDCASDPCDHGTCKDGINKFQCTCDAGFTGHRCQINVNECASNPCAHAGECMDGVNGFNCICSNGWIGTRCDMDRDDCSSKPCQNGASCVDKRQSYVCRCPAGFTGHDCETSIDYCQTNPCRNGGECFSGVKGFECVCRLGTKGRTCQIDLGRCKPNPCKSGGACSPTVEGFECDCLEGFEGDMCEINIDDCRGHRCQNGARCIDQANRYSCRCLAGFTGQFCGTSLDICSALPCLNDGECISTGNRTHHCICRSGFTGAQCDVAINHCQSNPCLHGGTCRTQTHGYSCVCLAGFTGSDCAENIDECSAHVCQNEARCIDGLNDYQCKCRRGFEGRYCDEYGISNYDMVFQSGKRSQYVTLRNAIVEPLQAFTLTLWIRTESSYSLILAYKYSFTRRIEASRLELALRNPGALEIEVKGQSFVSSVSVNDNRWHHLAVTWDSVQGLLSLFKDGLLAKRWSSLTGNNPIRTGGLFTLGELLLDTRSLRPSLDGALSNVNLWDQVLNSSTIADIARVCGSLAPGNTIAASDFIEKSTLGRIQIDTPSLCHVVALCSSSPCPPSHHCTDDGVVFTCQCPLGFTGQSCESNIDDCGTGSLCDNGGSCIDGINIFTCQCAMGYSGRFCELRQVDGGYSEWVDVGECSTSCGGGIQIRRRSCNNPRSQNGGRRCIGALTDIQPCNTQPCLVCKDIYPPFRGDMDCSTNGLERNCTISCSPGTAFSEDVLPFYRCGPSTGSTWSHETDERKLVFPECTKFKPPAKLSVEMALAYDMSCQQLDEETQAVIDVQLNGRTRIKLMQAPCILAKTCKVKKIKVKGCSGANTRVRKRSLDAISVYIILEYNLDIPDREMLSSEEVTNVTRTMVETLEEIPYLMHNSEVAIGDLSFEINRDETWFGEKPVCPPGMVRAATEDAQAATVDAQAATVDAQAATVDAQADARCVACPAGSYDDGDACRKCPKGMYQAWDTKTYCTNCPRGYTTDQVGVSDSSECKIM